jgi:hypothetical protein
MFLSLAGCAAPPALATTPPVAAQPQGWKALLIAGGDEEPAFDNAVDGMADRLAAFAVPRPNITVLKATAAGHGAATIDNIRAAFAALRPAVGEGCFVFVTSHGAPRRGLVLQRSQEFLGPRELGGLLDTACGSRPTVVVASGCFSGSFAEGKSMPAPNRVILTAARDDRPSFGCNADRHYTVFDGCILDNLGRGMAWGAVMERVRACVTDNERALGITSPSGPLLSIGADVGMLLAFPG